jgi:acyl-CoA reductase-like NAD-dependent aldehyde dehydrogenase
MRAAAEHLTPVTLELGGKSPALVDASADLDAAARSIVWGRCINAGQTCVAPDYVLVDKRVEEALVAKIGATLRDYYGARVADSPDFGRIVSEGHFKRVCALLQGDHGGSVAFGGETDAATRFIAPTVIRNPRQDSALMRDEIFGPLLPVIGVDSLQRAVADWVAPREKPLALYVYARSGSAVRWVLENTSSGGVTVNDSVLHLANSNLPFGGVGHSGMGAYHGRAGFEALSHRRSVLVSAPPPLNATGNNSHTLAAVHCATQPQRPQPALPHLNPDSRFLTPTHAAPEHAAQRNRHYPATALRAQVRQGARDARRAA